MRAVRVRSYGGPEVLEVVDVEAPEPGPGQVLVRVTAAPVTPVDLDTRAGELADYLGPRDFYALGREAAGVVERPGPGVEHYRPGDRVIGMCESLTAPLAAQADLVVFDEAAMAPAPATVSDAEASTLPLNGLTADQALDRLGLGDGRTVLITGAAGGVGGFAVELAVLRGLHVVATARAGDERLVRGLGALDFVPADADLTRSVRELVPGGVDGALDTAVLRAPALRAVRDGGRFVALVVGGEPAPERDIAVTTVWTSADGARLAELARLVDAGRLTPRVAEQFALDDVAAAHVRFARGGLRGHLVLVP
jgi:NADPH2:quinone reductase